MTSLADADRTAVIETGASLSSDERKARYGLAYVRSICSQAGAPMEESSPGEDVLAVDCCIEFPQGDVRVQVKCTSRWTIGGSSLTFPIEQEWTRKWDDCFLPVYFVVVIVPKLEARHWLRHDTEGTFHHAAAFWTRLPPGEVGSSVSVPKNQRLTIATISSWHQDLLAVGKLVRP